VEDFLGAGAIVAALRGLGMSPVSPEAELAATAFLGTAEVPRAIAECVSGRELAAHANSDDVVLAGQVGVSSAAPRLVAGVLRGD
jgi:2-phosphosulfolactate phosphatase